MGWEALGQWGEDAVRVERLAGRGAGSLKPGKHVIAPAGTPITNLYLSLLERMGAHQEKLGDSTGQLDLL